MKGKMNELQYFLPLSSVKTKSNNPTRNKQPKHTNSPNLQNNKPTTKLEDKTTAAHLHGIWLKTSFLTAFTLLISYS